MRTERRATRRGWSAAAPWIAAIGAAAAIFASARGAFAGDVTVERDGAQVFVTGSAGSDRILVTSTAPGELRVASADVATTVGGASETVVQVGSRTSLYFRLGGGLNAARIESLPRVRRAVVLVAARGADDFTLSGAVVEGDLTFVGNAGSDRLALEAGARVTGNLLAAMGDGSDTVSITDSEIVRDAIVDLGDGIGNSFAGTRFLVGAECVVTGGDGVDDVRFANAQIERSLRVDLGAGDDVAAVGSLCRVGRQTTILTGDDDDSVTLDGDSLFANRVLVDAGSGDDGVTVGLAQFERGLRIVGGDGADDIELSEFEVVYGALVVLAGAGDDTVVADDAASFHVGESASGLDGGTGRDQLVGGVASGVPARRFEIRR
jgi:hypothetical protein